MKRILITGAGVLFIGILCGVLLTPEIGLTRACLASGGMSMIWAACISWRRT